MSRRGRPPYPDVLTPREFEVLELLRQGLSNPDIAGRLGISRDGAKYHVSEILTKLGLSTREEAAVWSAQARPWWAAAGAPLALLGRRMATAIGVGVLGAAVAGLALLAFLLLRGGGGDGQPSSGEDQPSRHELAYFSSDGSLWLYDADTDERRLLAQDGVCGTFSRIEWSPTGERLACIGSDSGEVFADGRIVVRDTTGAVVGQIEEAGIADVYWSPAGEVFLYGVDLFVEPPSTGARRYRIADDTGRQLADLGAWDLTGVVWPAQASYGFPFWSPNGNGIVFRRSANDQVNIFWLNTGYESVWHEGYAPLAWAFGGQALIVGAQYQPLPSVAAPAYQAFLIGLYPPGQVRLTALDNAVQFWMAPPYGERIVYVTRGQRADGLPGLGVIDLRTGEARPIEGSLITYGSDHIPPEWVTFSRDGEWVYWVGGDNAGYRARLDGSGLEKVIELDEPGFTWSPDHELASYVGTNDDGVTRTSTLYILRPDGSRRVIDERSTSGVGVTTVPRAAAWRSGY